MLWRVTFPISAITQSSKGTGCPGKDLPFTDAGTNNKEALSIFPLEELGLCFSF